MRQYSSPLRDEQARQTRRAIADAALRLFVSNGYVETSIRSIADEAGVSERTVYAVFKDKTSILKAAADHAYYGGSQEGEGEAVFREALEELADPMERLRAVVHQGAVGKATGLAVIPRMLRVSARGDSRLAEFMDEMVDYRHRATRSLVEILLGRQLPADASIDQMIDELEALSSEETFLLLTGERGWDLERYEEYIVDMFVVTLSRYGIDL